MDFFLLRKRALELSWTYWEHLYWMFLFTKEKAKSLIARSRPCMENVLTQFVGSILNYLL